MGDGTHRLSQSLDEQVHSALRNWNAVVRTSGILGELLLYKQALNADSPTPRIATNQVLSRALGVLQRRSPEAAELLRLRFSTRMSVEVVGERLGFAGSTVFSKQAEAIHQLTDVVSELEAQAWKERELKVSERIDSSPYSGIIGIDSLLAHLESVVTRPAPPWLISIEGIGGIGKTTLANQLLRQQANALNFGDFAWVSAKPQVIDSSGGVRNKYSPALTSQALVNTLVQQLMPDGAATLLADPDRAASALQARLKLFPHLVVIDNLETVEDLESLVPILHTFAQPSKFILTSRERLLSESGIYLFLVPELDAGHAFELIRQEAHFRNLSELAQADDQILDAIYQTVGGNPLALLLVVGQIHVFELQSVLADLRSARGVPVENLYSYIYRRAWDRLDPLARQVLLVMPLVTGRGEGAEFIAAVAGLPASQVLPALHHLHRLNLIQVGGDLHQRRYTIHSLTRTFLHRQVAAWL